VVVGKFVSATTLLLSTAVLIAKARLLRAATLKFATTP